MSMYDAFKYFSRMAELVADDGVDESPTAPDRWPARLIRVLRRRQGAHRPRSVPSLTVVGGTRRAALTNGAKSAA
jgi:hypothetical protein